MYTYSLLALILGGIIALVAAGNAAGADNPAGALIWLGLGSSLFGTGALSLFLFLHASATIAGKDPLPSAVEDTERETNS